MSLWDTLARSPSIRFALVVLSSFVLSSVLFTVSSGFIGNQIGHVSKHLEEWWEVEGLLAWRVAEIGLAWSLGFDGFDVASFMYLTHLPTNVLLVLFYDISATPIVLSSLITTLSTVIPFVLLRQPSVHKISKAPSAVANRATVQDISTTIFTTITATCIYASILFLSFATWLPAHLVVHFGTIVDISIVHDRYEAICCFIIPLAVAGIATRQFLFVSSIVGSGSENPDSKTRILISRSAIIAIAVILTTIIQLAGTIESISVKGAAGLGAVFATSTVVAGATFGWIEAED